MAHMSILPGYDDSTFYMMFKQTCINRPSVLLDVIDATLHLPRRIAPSDLTMLRDTLEHGNSIWTVSVDGKALVRRVDAMADQTATQVISTKDSASVEVAEAWRAAYSRQPNPSDAWDHSIKAVEHVLQPVVSPNNVKATLGTIIRDLRDGKHKHRFVLPGKDATHDVDRLLAMLELLWPNPDRHGGSAQRPPTLEEAQAVVHLAVTVVQWVRAGALTKR